LLTARQANVSVDNYIDRISRKTACLMSACCKGGAIVGDGNEEQIALLGQFGLDLATGPLAGSGRTHRQPQSGRA